MIGSVRDLWADGRPSRPPKRWQARIGWKRTKAFENREEAESWLRSQSSAQPKPEEPLWVPWGEIAFDHEGRFVCHFCGRGFHLLATHLTSQHAMNSATYRVKTGLSGRQGLCSLSVSRERSDRAQRDGYVRWFDGTTLSHPDYGDPRVREIQSRKAKAWVKSVGGGH